MTFTEEDIPLMKLIFNPTTHDMGMLVGKERAEDIWKYVSNQIKPPLPNYGIHINRCYYRILSNNLLCDFFWDNNILQLSYFEVEYLYHIFELSPIACKIWKSRKIDISSLHKKDLEYFKRKFKD